jgi:hypothetical protein
MARWVRDDDDRGDVHAAAEAELAWFRRRRFGVDPDAAAGPEPSPAVEVARLDEVRRRPR